MNISSEFSLDFPHPKPEQGSYEWWYFDAADSRDDWQIVIIYYDGCPFSTAYNKAIDEQAELALAANHPAITISLYFRGKPVFYSTSEYPENEAEFNTGAPQKNPGEPLKVALRVGKNRLLLQYDEANAKLKHQLFLDEALPSGDHLEGILSFTSDAAPAELFRTSDDKLTKYNENTSDTHKSGHGWNLTQPRASVVAQLELKSALEQTREIRWKGTGYHDHNLGSEPMKNEFTDWYWGRFHFPEHTLIYYLMRTDEGLSYKAWLLDGQMKLQHTLTSGRLESYINNAFMLPAARIIELREENSTGEGVRVMIQQSQAIDSGPFYYRFRSEAMLHIGPRDMIEQARGITEYIRPDRIHYRLFWPLVHMRYRYVNAPHWVQRSPRLYRWTW